MSYFEKLSEHADLESIKTIHQDRQKWVNQDKKGFLRYRQPYLELSKYQSQNFNCQDGIVSIGRGEEISNTSKEKITSALKEFMPWRKGPFSIFDIDIDAEWRSEKKWARVQEHLPNLEGKVIADIGCNNGYYMFRMADHNPKLVLGLEPSVQHYYCFKSLNAIAQKTNLEIDLLGVEHLPYFKECFDVLFLMGIIYHRPSPIETLKDILTSLKPGGTLILETQGIPGELPTALFPDKTYAKVPGTYFVPTASCLINWLNKAGFIDSELFHSHPMNNSEQRRTNWMEFESYEDFIDPNNPEITIEGYPSPHRFFVKARKKLK
ncbi:MAG: tRNA 5-methoxyuridine(34)/uridine 5-oxyacetic acid(34) synthase CmoB [Desulfotalea sp.]